jgi:hypothetical protein
MQNIHDSIYADAQADDVTRSCIDAIACTSYRLRGIELPHAHPDMEVLRRHTMFFLYRQAESAARALIESRFSEAEASVLESQLAEGFACEYGEGSKEALMQASDALVQASEAIDINRILTTLESRDCIRRLDVMTAPKLVSDFTEGAYAIADKYRIDPKTHISTLLGEYL